VASDDSGGITPAAPWLALVGVNVVLAWYVRRRLQATRRRQAGAASGPDDDSDGAESDRRPQAAHFVE
jgi:hypothetical protein